MPRQSSAVHRFVRRGGRVVLVPVLLILSVAFADEPTDPAIAAKKPATTKTVTLEAKGADVRETLASFARDAGIRIQFGPGVEGKVTVSLRNVAVGEALQRICQAANPLLTCGITADGDYLVNATTRAAAGVPLNARSRSALADTYGALRNLSTLDVTGYLARGTSRQLLIPAEPLNKPVNLAMTDTTLEAVLKKLAQQAGLPITLHEAAPKDMQIANATLYGITLREALQMLLQQTGLRALPTADHKGIVIAPPNRIELSRLETATNPFGPARGSDPLADLFVSRAARDYAAGADEGVPEGGVAYEARSPGLPAGTTACAKCKASLQTNWLYCPKCGTKNEKGTTKDWKFCPLCGKQLPATKP